MTGPTYLERMREETGAVRPAAHAPRWRVERADDRFTWIFDGDRAVGLVDGAGDSFELRCPGPWSPCPPARLPAHYHIVTHEGVRILYAWRLKGKAGGPRTGAETVVDAAGGEARLRCAQTWTDGSRSDTDLRLRYEPAWGAYVADVRAAARVRRATTALEYCNVLPAAIGDSRPGRERYPATFWKHPDGLRKMLKNPLWFNSVGAQDHAGVKHIEPGGFIGFGPDERMNPVVEVAASDPPSGAQTCDGLQDEHVVVWPATGRQAAATGWFDLRAHYRLFSIPPGLAAELVGRAAPFDHGPMLAWKFQYPALAELPADLTGVELPGSPFYGPSDWSRPVSWREPFNGRLWTASPDPAADIHYDRAAGRARPGSIRLRVRGGDLRFWPGSGHTLHTEAGVTYRASVWIRTAGDARGRLIAAEMLHRLGDREQHPSATVGPASDWTRVEAGFTARGDEAPFAETVLCAEGSGEVWFTDLAFEPV